MGFVDRKAPLRVALPQSFVKFTGTLDIRSMIGGQAAHPPFASGSFEKRGRNPDLCGGVNSATVALLGHPGILNPFLPQLCSSRSVAHLARAWEPGRMPARMRAKRRAFGEHLGLQEWPEYLPYLPAFLLSSSCHFYHSPTVMSRTPG